MVGNILGARAVHRVRSESDLARKHAAALAKAREFGADVAAHDAAAPLTARVDHGRWIGDCACGSGVALERGWSEARCFGCGAVSRVIVFPGAADQVEALLIRRPSLAARNWSPGESMASLLAENAAHGIGGT